MALVDSLLPEFDHEMTVTRKLLERVPEDRFNWKPHEKSYTLGPARAACRDRTDVGIDHDQSVGARSRWWTAAAGGRRTGAALLALFDGHVAGTRAALVGKSDAELMAPWTLKNGGKTLFSMPKAMVWRSFVMSHLIHHRGQLSVYLRIQNVPLPSMYGPSADENPFS